MESASFSNPLAPIHQSTRHQISDKCNDHQQNCEDLKSRMLRKINSLISQTPFEGGPWRLLKNLDTFLTHLPLLSIHSNFNMQTVHGGAAG